MSEVFGPAWTDERGELETPYLSCAGCSARRIYDFHYLYCAALKSGNPNWNHGYRHLLGSGPDKECPHPVRNPELAPPEVTQHLSDTREAKRPN